MYKELQLASVFIILLAYHCYGQYLPFQIQFYEYGEHVEGEQISYVYNGIIPGFLPSYKLNATPNHEDLKSVFTYLRVEYYNLLSDVSVSYDPQGSKLEFHIKFPFVDTPIGVVGYSLRK